MPEPYESLPTPAVFHEIRRELSDSFRARVGAWACAPQEAAAHLEIPEVVLAALMEGRTEAVSLDALAELAARASRRPPRRPAYGLAGRCPI